MYVVDTNVIFADDPVKRRYGSGQALRLQLDERDLYVTTVTVAEIRFGILSLRNRGSDVKAERLAEWWAGLVDFYADRILPFDLAAAEAAASLAASCGERPGWADLQIAAIAASRGYAVLTRNLKDFRRIGVSCLDPFAEQG